jgi:hypothetical protein
MRSLSFIALLGFASVSLAQDFKSRLAVTASSSTDPLIEFAQKFNSLGDIQPASFNHRDIRIFTTWVEPRPGQPASTLIQAYYLRDKKGYLFLDEAAVARDILCSSRQLTTSSCISPPTEKSSSPTHSLTSNRFSRYDNRAA